jgi:hypothetical protein
MFRSIDHVPVNDLIFSVDELLMSHLMSCLGSW